MRKINENDFDSYTIVGHGWTLTVVALNKAVREWNNLNGAGYTMYGNKPDGTRAIIETK